MAKKWVKMIFPTMVYKNGIKWYIKVVDNVENYVNIKGAPPEGFESRQVGTFFTLYVIFLYTCF